MVKCQHIGGDSRFTDSHGHVLNVKHFSVESVLIRGLNLLSSASVEVQQSFGITQV